MNAAHDFNNLLTVVICNAECALALVEPRTPLHEMLDDILTAGKRAGKMTEQLLVQNAADASARTAGQGAA